MRQPIGIPRDYGHQRKSSRRKNPSLRVASRAGDDRATPPSWPWISPAVASWGAVWYRLMTFEEPGYGFVDDSTPEIALAILPDHRGRGMGGALLEEIRDVARSRGYGALSLSVEHGNPALRLYERSGFVKLFETEDAWTMKVDLSTGEA
jgi:ribosomal protein S18 acetylase RimI-like enzyme